MCSFSKLDRHAGLVNRMASTLGVDLQDEMLSGRMGPREYRFQVLRCSGCSDPGACAKWLDEQGGFAEAAPEYCRNKDDLETRATLPAPV